MLLKKIALAAGIIFFLMGVLGFVPGLAPDDKLFALFHVNRVHNIFHIVTGIIAFWVSFESNHAAKVFFEVFGIVYVLLGVLGFGYGDQEILGVVANNMPDSWFHLIVGILGLYLGFGLQHKIMKATVRPKAKTKTK